MYTLNEFSHNILSLFLCYYFVTFIDDTKFDTIDKFVSDNSSLIAKQFVWINQP